MSWAGFEVWDVHLCAHKSGSARPGEQIVWTEHADLMAALKPVMERVRAGRTRWGWPRLNVWLSGAMARPFVVEPMEGLNSEREFADLAQARAMEATGLGSTCAVWLSAENRAQPRLAVAVEQALVDAVQSAGREARVWISSIRPWWAGALDAALASDPALDLFAAQDADSLTLLVANGETWRSADGYAPSPGGAQIESLIVRRSFAAGLSAAAAVRVSFRETGGDVAGERTDELCFSRRVSSFAAAA